MQHLTLTGTILSNTQKYIEIPTDTLLERAHIRSLSKGHIKSVCTVKEDLGLPQNHGTRGPLKHGLVLSVQMLLSLLKTFSTCPRWHLCVQSATYWSNGGAILTHIGHVDQWSILIPILVAPILGGVCLCHQPLVFCLLEQSERISS